MMRFAATPRRDAAAKLAGAAGFHTDRYPPGMLYAAVLRSPHPHARIIEIDCADAVSLPGVAALVTAADVPGRNRFGVWVADQPVLCEDLVRCIGDPVAAVAAETPQICAEALRRVKVQYESLPLVGDARAALHPEAPLLHRAGNLCHVKYFARGDLTAAFAASTYVAEETYRTPRQMHGFLETEGALAVPGADGVLTIYAPGHFPMGERDQVAAILGLDPARVAVVSSPVGGSFGGKDALHAQPIAALLAHKTGRPVRLHWTREESVAYGSKRHPFVIRMRTGCDAAGRLLAHESELLADTGAYAQYGPEVLETAYEAAPGPYEFDAVAIAARLVYTNNGISSAFRGFGALQVTLALEMQIDRLAAACGIDALRFRAANLRPPNAKGPLGQSVAASPERRDIVSAMERRRSRQGVAKPAAPGARHATGIGLSLVAKAEGYTRGIPNGGAGTLALAADGAIELRLGFSELGQGLIPAALRMTARRLDIAPQDIRIVLGDSRVTESAGPTSASRGTGITSRIIDSAAAPFRDALLARAGDLLDLAPSELRVGPGGIWSGSVNAPLLDFAALARGAPDLLSARGEALALAATDGDAASHLLFTSCGAIAEVTVDRWTGSVTARRIVVFPACGPVIEPASYRGQCEGGAAMAAGFVLTESLPVVAGRFRAANLDGYFMPSIADAPIVEVVPIEHLAPDDPQGVRGIGEVILNAVAPAIVSAVHDAIGFAATSFPIDPAAVLAHLQRAGDQRCA
jgi:CO/xanthine dehydrogenase Mo-binding subunit